MPFNSLQFGLFFALVYLASVAVGARRVVPVLLVASFVFYALWTPRALVVLGLLLLVNWSLCRRMAESSRPKTLLVVSIAVTLSTLSAFKYGSTLLPVLAVRSPVFSELAARSEWMTMPIGISFYCFEIVSLAVDVQAGRLPCPSLGRYALFVTFFPHLIAGPILRGGELLPQLDRGGERTAERTRRGAWLFVVGLLKKVVLSDYLLSPFVQEVFAAPGASSGPAHLVAAYSFAFQIYSDFSGYSDMARGIACVLGFELPMNFEEPYLSRSPSEFWQRWHMTLSRWLRDYLYIPLGGNRHGRARTAVNLLLTMALGGLWHGAGVNFLLWGALHGVLLVTYRFLGKGGRDNLRPLSWSDLPRVLFFFNLVCLLWIPFRSPTWAVTVQYLGGLEKLRTYAGAWPLLPTCSVAIAALAHALERSLRPRIPAILGWIGASPWGPAVEGAFVGSCLMLAFLASGAGVQFIYFQF